MLPWIESLDLDVDIDALLGRQPVELDKRRLAHRRQDGVMLAGGQWIAGGELGHGCTMHTCDGCAMAPRGTRRVAGSWVSGGAFVPIA